MKRERVDLLFLHEPIRELVDTDEWLRWTETERDRVGAMGVAGEAERILPFVQTASPLATVVQTRDSLARQEAAPVRAAGCRPHITYGHLAHRDAALRAAATLTDTIACWPDTVLLVSTRHVERIRELERASLMSESRLQVGARA